jgi:hypothetical protein
MMPAWIIALTVFIFLALMVALKLGLAASINSFGLWILVPFALLVVSITLLIDRSDKKRRAP